MTPLNSCLGAIFKLLFRLVKVVAMWTLKQIITFIRFAAPHALRLVFSALGQAIWVVILSVLALFRGMGSVADTVAERWLENALANGFPTLWERQLRYTFKTLARLTIITGWTMLLFTEYYAVDYALKKIFAD